ncbi:hypothetical protein PVAG01_08819 [Phlyctema vagabunda]|uniref:F-box domain-containing protein n=1 Tax=Phlyctema vagabunda TaxID=108571 RepID=A0ABR4PAK8_9HELO
MKSRYPRMWVPIKIPHKILDAPPDLSAPLLQLPTEILALIFNHADDTDRLCLALASRFLLRLSSSLNIKTLVAKEHYLACSCNKVEDILRRLKPLNRRGKPSKAWIICLDCSRYRPARKSYWKKWQVDRQEESFMPRIESLRSGWFMDRIEFWNSGSSTQCPECWLQECNEEFRSLR